ncbi:LLM class flavin-dependent oxidoreductase [Solwaraspora sp. WMMD1047]|uniref:LLM class flavin-dependent oxidoreductase n=1 Tax=Solwaraspora sp. WMMD1047 TaxID=3016102 RepID=UPI002416EEE4|nr:LLM class flavin-dependent oxidoreductase [Solwaraspora sp. WMMD1047]MDG4829597.1 LLM class flavin-dependent oxidoreductase [Solwaraspora sp. WMMD1047]
MSAYPVRVGVHSGQQYATFGAIQSLWETVEDAGLDWVSLFDHYRPVLGDVDDPCLDGLTTLAALAAHTRRVRCALMVAAPAWRHPALLAYSIATIDQISNGRAELGLGAGGGDRGYQQFGIDRPPAGERHDILDEYCAVVTGLLREPSFSFSGRYYRLRDAHVSPRPARPVPLTIGATGERRGLRAVARWADTWNTIVLPEPVYARKRDVLDRWCVARERDPAAIRRSMTFRTVLSSAPSRTRTRRDAYRAALGPEHPDLAEQLDADSPAHLLDVLGRYRALGVTDFLLALRPPLDLETLEVFATEVVPALRAQPAVRNS